LDAASFPISVTPREYGGHRFLFFVVPSSSFLGQTYEKKRGTGNYKMIVTVVVTVVVAILTVTVGGPILSWLSSSACKVSHTHHPIKWTIIVDMQCGSILDVLRNAALSNLDELPRKHAKTFIIAFVVDDELKVRKVSSSVVDRNVYFEICQH
jgi:hypothetical protein